jgi:hypothetical protein
MPGYYWTETELPVSTPQDGITANFPNQQYVAAGSGEFAGDSLRRVMLWYRIFIALEQTNITDTFHPDWYQNLFAAVGLWCDKGRPLPVGGPPIVTYNNNPAIPWVLVQMLEPRITYGPSPAWLPSPTSRAQIELRAAGSPPMVSQAIRKGDGANVPKLYFSSRINSLLPPDINDASPGWNILVGGMGFVRALWHTSH